MQIVTALTRKLKLNGLNETKWTAFLSNAMNKVGAQIEHFKYVFYIECACVLKTVVVVEKFLFDVSGDWMKWFMYLLSLLLAHALFRHFNAVSVSNWLTRQLHDEQNQLEQTQIKILVYFYIHEMKTLRAPYSKTFARSGTSIHRWNELPYFNKWQMRWKEYKCVCALNEIPATNCHQAVCVWEIKFEANICFSFE